MVPSRIESVLLAQPQDHIRSFGRIAGGLLMAFVIASFVYHSLLEQLVPGWPVVNIASTVVIGTGEVPYSTVSLAVQFVVLGVALTASFIPASRDHGLFISLLVAMVVPVGFLAGEAIYYSLPPIGFQYGGPSEVIKSIGLGGIIGAPVGAIGFLLGRIKLRVSTNHSQ